MKKKRIGLRKVSKTELKEILKTHKEWLKSEYKRGRQADLSGTNLAKIDLSQAKLFGTKLSGANLEGTNLSEMNLERTDLYGANLEGVDFSGANLEGANLTEAELSDANLEGADLRKADLEGTNLCRANLKEANLEETNLFMANLTEAELSGANLTEAELFTTNLTSAILKNACFNRTVFYETIFANIDLSGVIGLEECNFYGPCTIDHRTLLQSSNLPEAFLKGCGLPDELINYLPSLLGKAIDFYSCFISYSHEDEEFTKRLHADLQAKGVRCWYAPEDFRIGDKMRPKIDEVIRIHDKLLIVLSENSVKSKWVAHEVNRALDKELKEERTVLFPIRLDDKVFDVKKDWVSQIVDTRLIGDFREWKEHDKYQKAFKRLLRDLKSKKPKK